MKRKTKARANKHTGKLKIFDILNFDVLKSIFLFDKEAILNQDLVFKFETEGGLEQKVQQIDEKPLFQEKRHGQLTYTLPLIKYRYKVSIPYVSIQLRKLKGPVEEQVALEKATERLNPLQPLKLIKPYWEADFIKKIFHNIAEFFGLDEIYSKQRVSYSFMYNQDEDNKDTLY